LLIEFQDIEMYKVPTGYNVQKSVYALDADLKLSQDQPQKDGRATGQVAAPAPGPAEVSMQPTFTKTELEKVASSFATPSLNPTAHTLIH